MSREKKIRNYEEIRLEWWIVLANHAIDRVRWFSRWNHDYLGNYTVPVVRGLPDLPRLVALLPWTGGSERVPCIRVNCLPEICIKSSSSSFRGSLTGRVPLSVKIPDAQPDIGVIFSRSFTADCVYLLKMPTILTKKNRDISPLNYATLNSQRTFLLAVWIFNYLLLPRHLVNLSLGLEKTIIFCYSENYASRQLLFQNCPFICVICDINKYNKKNLYTCICTKIS